MAHFNRRDILRLAGIGLMTPFVLKGGTTLSSDDARWFRFNSATAPLTVFDLGVASGDPTPDGVVLWTRVNPAAFHSDQPLAFEVATDARFLSTVYRGLVQPQNVGPYRDYTVKVDLAGHLQPDRFYYYRFIHAQVASTVGRCRTLPTPGANLSSLRLGIVTCQDYTNGYYRAFHHLAQEDLHFVLHMGDYIYETAGDPSFQSLPFPDRRLVLPSKQPAAMDLTDYRALYRAYRADANLQEALARHTFIHTWDDHETANDCYWNYDLDTCGAPDHPLTKAGADPAALRRLKLDSMRAWSEYVPARLQVNEASAHPHSYFSIHRSFRFGSLAELFMTEGRSHRSPHPNGEGMVGQRYAGGDSPALDDPGRTMLGPEQREWLRYGILGSQAQWKLWGNPVYSGVLKAGAMEYLEIFFDLDAWDGYRAERDDLMKTFKGAGVRNLITFTGDLHTSLAGYMKVDYWNPFNTWAPDNLVGVELMTPSVTSASLKDLLYNALKIQGQHPDLDVVLDVLTQDAVILNNPHLKFFDGDRHGYLVATLTSSGCEALWVSVDKDDPQAGRSTYKHMRVPADYISLDTL